MTLGTTLLLYSSATFSHPHNWIDLRSQINIDEQGRLIGFSQHWRFDQFFSMINYAELMNEYNDESLGLTNTALEMVTHVADKEYFSTLNVAGEGISLPTPQHYSLESVQLDGSPSLTLKMNFVLTEPILVKGKKITLQTLEPTYFVAMNYPSEQSIIIKSDNLDCSVELIKAKVSDDLLNYANSLDRNMKNTQGLGNKFAERVNIQC